MYRFWPSMQVRWHFFHSLDLHHPISSQFRCHESYQDDNPDQMLHFSLGQFCFSLWTPVPFKHIYGYITPYICVFGHRIILKSLQFTSHVRMDNSIICVIIPTIAILIHWTGTSIYTFIRRSGTLIYTKRLIISFIALSSLQVGTCQSSWQL